MLFFLFRSFLSHDSAKNRDVIDALRHTIAPWSSAPNLINMDLIFFHKSRLELLSVETGHMTDGLECNLGHAGGRLGRKLSVIWILPVGQMSGLFAIGEEM